MKDNAGMEQKMGQMCILVVSSILIFKETRFGGAKRLYSFLDTLANRCELHVVCMDVSDEASWYRKCKQPFQNFLFLPDCSKPLPFLKKIIHAPMNISPNVRDCLPAFETFIRSKTFDAVLLVYPLAISFANIPCIQKIGKIIHVEDDLSLEILRKEMYRISKKTPFQWIRRIQALSFYRKQTKFLSAWIAISDQEKKIIQSYFPGLPVHILKYGVNLYDYPILPPPTTKACIGFIGNFKHPPNIDAADYLFSEVIPECIRRIEGVRFIIAGKNIPFRIRQAGTRWPNIVQFLEDIPNIRDFYKEINIFVNPIVSGRGLRTKCIEAAAFGRPIVSTALGAEGLDGLTLCIGEKACEIADHFKNLIQDEHNYKSIVQANRSCVETRYDSKVLGEHLLQILREPRIQPA